MPHICCVPNYRSKRVPSSKLGSSYSHKRLCPYSNIKNQIGRTAVAYDDRTGRKVVAPLKRLYLKNGTIPCVFKSIPKYLSDPVHSRESRDQRLARLENKQLAEKCESQKSLLTMSQFRNELAFVLCNKGTTKDVKKGRPSSSILEELLTKKKRKDSSAPPPPKDLRKDGLEHWPTVHHSRSNYDKQNTSSVLSFPEGEKPSSKMGSSYSQKRFCLYSTFKNQIGRTAVAYDERTGRKVVAPLKRLYLKNGAAPCVFKSIPKYLSDPVHSRESREDQRLARLENKQS
ncbi:hypothetical protein EVAR_87964_1 [Eumeta japonica]|uniref:Uncharacterized protein n=1 Tax=Eumeta variegata TaxID=151549 RepID=A0A4C1VFE2_EUMVA|nr:hypothetical protein EVAR_87964_1 [Eumeta japonica]